MHFVLAQDNVEMLPDAVNVVLSIGACATISTPAFCAVDSMFRSSFHPCIIVPPNNVSQFEPVRVRGDHSSSMKYSGNLNEVLALADLP